MKADGRRVSIAMNANFEGALCVTARTSLHSHASSWFNARLGSADGRGTALSRRAGTALSRRAGTALSRRAVRIGSR